MCEYPSCEEPTRLQKPYCVEHLELNPYAAEVLRRIEERERADERVRREGHQVADLEATTAIEIVLYLELRGERTFRRICRDLNLDKPMAWAYVTKLHIFCRISRTRSDQGVWRIRIRGTPAAS